MITRGPALANVARISIRSACRNQIVKMDLRIGAVVSELWALFEFFAESAEHGSDPWRLTACYLEKTFEASSFGQERNSALDGVFRRELTGLSGPAEKIEQSRICVR